MKCKHCRQPMVGTPPSEKLHAECVLPWIEHFGAKQKRKKAAEQSRAYRRKRETLKTIPMLIKETQVAFNRYIRLRDQAAGFPCISSGRQLDWSGNAVDAGHYRSTGAASHLRFNADNCHAQSKHDNQYKAGNAVDYRLALIARIGLARVEALESDNTPKKWTRDELRAIKAEYMAKCRDFAKAEA